jgi:hypothetical protein
VARRKPPLPNVLRVYESARWGYEWRVPDVWYERALDVEDGEGVLFAPDPEDLSTFLSIELRDLGTEVTVEDLPNLKWGFLRGLRSVTGSRLLHTDSFASEFSIGVEAIQTYAAADEGGDVRRKRWIRLLYKDSRQARLIAQGATIREFDRLQPLFAPCVTTFMFSYRPADAP